MAKKTNDRHAQYRRKLRETTVPVLLHVAPITRAWLNSLRSESRKTLSAVVESFRGKVT